MLHVRARQGLHTPPLPLPSASQVWRTNETAQFWRDADITIAADGSFSVFVPAGELGNICLHHTYPPRFYIRVCVVCLIACRFHRHALIQCRWCGPWRPSAILYPCPRTLPPAIHRRLQLVPRGHHPCAVLCRSDGLLRCALRRTYAGGHTYRMGLHAQVWHTYRMGLHAQVWHTRGWGYMHRYGIHEDGVTCTGMAYI